MAVSFIVLLTLVHAVYMVSEPCLIISEVNADNPKLDTTEFVELYHTSGKTASLDGYTLVFYNGNGNTAYKVLNLTSLVTDPRGFFLVGSGAIKPAIILPPNTVQNGPDAIVLYHGNSTAYSEKMNVTTIGLVDAIVYTTPRSKDADFLADILTPGIPAFLEDEHIHESDESMERCWLSSGSWTFQVGLPTPGQHNQCVAPKSGLLQIRELQLGESLTEGFVELSVPRSTEPLALVLVDGRTATVTFSMDVNASKEGLLLISSKEGGLKGDVVFPPGSPSVLNPQALYAGAVAVYSGKAADFPVGKAISLQEPLDAFVYAGPDGTLSANLTESLIPGREAFQLSRRIEQGGITLSRCGTASWNRDPGVFIKTVQTPGKVNYCLWPQSCPKMSVTPEATALPPGPSPWDPAARQDFLLNEVNTDSPGAGEDTEFVEIWHPAGRRVSLQGIWLVFFSGHDSKPYRQISLTGYFTDAHGYFLVGSDRLVPEPSVRLPPNTIQNGPDAVALYRSASAAPSLLSDGVPTQGLLDAIVYRQRGSDKEARELSNALTPGQLPLFEDPIVLKEDESLSRCYSLHPSDLSSFVVMSPTPLRKNVCPEPPAGVAINEISSSHWTSHSEQSSFVELSAPPLAKLHGLFLVVFQGGLREATLRLPLMGSAKHDGFYLIGNASGADQAWPVEKSGLVVPSHGAVALCYGPLCFDKAGPPGTNSSLMDAVAFTKDPQLLNVVGTSVGQVVMPVLRSVEGPVSLSRCSCCGSRGSLAWTSSTQTPSRANLCPSSNFSSSIDLCFGPSLYNGDKLLPNCSRWGQEDSTGQQVETAAYLEEQCRCGISALYLQEANFSCVEGWLHVHGRVRALSVQQRELIQRASSERRSHALGHGCSNAIVDRYVGTGPELGLQIGLVLGLILLLGLGAALFTYFYKKRQPNDYFSMELNGSGEEFDQL